MTNNPKISLWRGDWALNYTPHTFAIFLAFLYNLSYFLSLLQALVSLRLWILALINNINTLWQGKCFYKWHIFSYNISHKLLRPVQFLEKLAEILKWSICRNKPGPSLLHSFRACFYSILQQHRSLCQETDSNTWKQHW